MLRIEQAKIALGDFTLAADMVAELVAETGAALIMVTHAPENVRRITNQIMFITKNQTKTPQPATTVINNPPPTLHTYLN